MRIAILKTDDVRPELAAQHGEYPDQFARLLHQLEPTLDVFEFDVRQGQYPALSDDFAGYLITGSRVGVYDPLEWIAQLEDFVRSAFAAGKKIIGICFGHQLIAQALGGEARKSERGWGIGVHRVVIAQAESLPALQNHHLAVGEELQLLVSHQDQVITPPPGATVVAGSEFCPVAICQIDSRVLSFQGHPEFTVEYARGLLQLRREIYTEAEYQQALDSMQQATDHLLVAAWILDFLQADNAAG